LYANDSGGAVLGMNKWVVGSNPTRGMDICVCVYSVFMLSCVQVAALRRADCPSKEFYRLCKKIKKLKKRQGSNKGLQSHREWKEEIK
jgi:hypothetical protein